MHPDCQPLHGHTGAIDRPGVHGASYSPGARAILRARCGILSALAVLGTCAATLQLQAQTLGDVLRQNDVTPDTGLGDRSGRQITSYAFRNADEPFAIAWYRAPIFDPASVRDTSLYPTLPYDAVPTPRFPGTAAVPGLVSRFHALFAGHVPEQLVLQRTRRAVLRCWIQ